MSSFMNRAVVLAVVLSFTGIGTGNAVEAAVSESDDEELEEVVVLGQKPVRNPRALAAWLLRLRGTYRSEGTIAYQTGMPGQIARTVPATGALVCAGFGSGPGVQCEMRLSAGASDTRLDPGVMLLGLDIEMDGRVTARFNIAHSRAGVDP